MTAEPTAAPKALVVSTAEAAQQMGITRRRVNWLLNNGRLAGAQTAGGMWVVYQQSVDAWLRRPHLPGRPKLRRRPAPQR